MQFIKTLLNKLFCRHIPAPKRRPNGDYIYGVPLDTEDDDRLAELDRGQRKYCVRFDHPEIITCPKTLMQMGSYHVDQVSKTIVGCDSAHSSQTRKRRRRRSNNVPISTNLFNP